MWVQLVVPQDQPAQPRTTAARIVGKVASRVSGSVDSFAILSRKYRVDFMQGSANCVTLRFAVFDSRSRRNRDEIGFMVSVF